MVWYVVWIWYWWYYWLIYSSYFVAYCLSLQPTIIFQTESSVNYYLSLSINSLVNSFKNTFLNCFVQHKVQHTVQLLKKFSWLPGLLPCKIERKQLNIFPFSQTNQLINSYRLFQLLLQLILFIWRSKRQCPIDKAFSSNSVHYEVSY